MDNHLNPNLYDTRHEFVSLYGAGLIELLQPQENEYILDLGCGTGDLVSKISSHGAAYFDRPTQLEDSKEGTKDWIKMFAMGLFAEVPQEAQAAIIQEVESRLYKSQFIDGYWYADYKRIRVLGRKS